MLRPDGSPVIIDLELAAALPAAGGSDGRGTPGYMSPAQKAGKPPAVADDIYGFGALIYFLATAGDPGQTPRANAMEDRPLRRLRPDAPEWIASIVEACLHAGQKASFRTMHEVASALKARTRINTHEERPATADLPLLLERTIQGLKMNALSQSREGSGSSEPLDINTGFAGSVLALADLADPSLDKAMEQLHGLASVLARMAEEPGRARLPGLYVGDSGVAVSLLRAGQMLHSADIRERACRLMHEANALTHSSPDMFNGTAGRILPISCSLTRRRTRAFGTPRE